MYFLKERSGVESECEWLKKIFKFYEWKNKKFKNLFKRERSEKLLWMSAERGKGNNLI